MDVHHSATIGAARSGAGSRAPGQVIDFEVPDMFNRPWAHSWAEHFQQDMEKPSEELDLAFK